jgi:2,3-bisphosphoglycerate-dependent phosphoglycerate mutase
MGRVLIIRHCQSTGQEVDSPLTDQGRADARALAAELIARHRIERVVSSPFRRALDTIAPFAEVAGINVDVDARLAERRLAGSFYESRKQWLEAVRASLADLEVRFDGGESGREALERGWAVLIEAIESDIPLTALVTHGQLMTHVLGNIDSTFGFQAWQDLTTPDVYMVEFDETGHLCFERLWDSVS